MLEMPEEKTETSWAVQPKYDSCAWKKPGVDFTQPVPSITHSHSSCPAVLVRDHHISRSPVLTGAAAELGFSTSVWLSRIQRAVYLHLQLISPPVIRTASPSLTSSWSVFV